MNFKFLLFYIDYSKNGYLYFYISENKSKMKIYIIYHKILILTGGRENYRFLVFHILHTYFKKLKSFYSHLLYHII